jgi:hypothetical protein
VANLKGKIGGMAEIARDLAYRLYALFMSSDVFGLR